jgi:hypothetical protein
VVTAQCFLRALQKRQLGGQVQITNDQGQSAVVNVPVG